MSQRAFVDYYEVLQLNQSADAETLERVYRLLAKRYHPDNQTTGDSAKFAEVHEAFEVLSDPKRRASYDVKYDDNRSVQWKIFDQASAADGRDADRRIFHGILSLLYVARRRDPLHGGLGAVSLEKLLGVPRQHLEFPLWYLKQRGWLEVLDSGQLAITVSGIDKMADRELELPEDRLLAASSVVGKKPEVEEPDGDGREHALGTGAESPAAQPASSHAPPPAAPAAPGSSAAAGDAGFQSEDELARARDRARAVADRLRGQPS